MFFHMLDIVHFLNSWTQSVDNQHEAPVAPAGSSQDLYQWMRYWLELQHYQQNMSHMRTWIKTMCWFIDRKEQEEEERYFAKIRSLNAEVEWCVLEEYKKRLLACDMLLLICWILLAKVLGVGFLALMLGVHADGLSFYVSAPVLYEAPLSVADQVRYERTLKLSFEKMHDYLQDQCPNKGFSYLKLASTRFEEDRLEAWMEDGTCIVHYNDDDGETGILEVIPPAGPELSEEEQANRYADFQAVLFCNRQLLMMHDQYHVDFWQPSLLLDLPFPLDKPTPPYPGMPLDHRIACRTLYHFICLGVNVSFNGEHLTKEHLKQEGWAAVLFAEIETDTARDIIDCATILAY